MRMDKDSGRSCQFDVEGRITIHLSHTAGSHVPSSRTYSDGNDYLSRMNSPLRMEKRSRKAPGSRIALARIPVRTALEKGISPTVLMPLARCEGNRKKPVYEMHKWWARRLGVNFRALLLASLLPSTVHESTLWSEFFSKHNLKGLVVLDPFMGGGTTMVEASKIGASIYGNDIDPMAWFITKKEIDPWDEASFLADYLEIQRKVKKKSSSYYVTETSTGIPAEVEYYFWVELIPCPGCGAKIEGHLHHLLADDDERYRVGRRIAFCSKCHAIRILAPEQKKFVCRDCGERTNATVGPVREGLFTCPECGFSGRVSEFTDRSRPLEKRLFAISYVNPKLGSREFKRAEKYDFNLYTEAVADFASVASRLPIVRDEIPVHNRFDPRPVSFGYHKYSEMFNERQLLCLGTILSEILRVRDANNREYLLLAFSDCLASNNWFCSYAFGYRKLTPLFGIHSFRRVHRPVEGNVWGGEFGRGTFDAAVKKIVRGKRYGEKGWELAIEGDHSRTTHRVLTDEQSNIQHLDNIASEKRTKSVRLGCGDSRHLDWIEPKSVDMVLTDPPYFDNLSYSELSDFYYVWLRDHVNWPPSVKAQHSPSNEPLLVRSNTLWQVNDFTSGLTQVFRECMRVLKDEGMMVFTYHHNKPLAWQALAESLISSGFCVTKAFPVLSEGKSGFHSSKGSLKWDMVFVCRKRNSHVLPSFSKVRVLKRVDNELKRVEVRMETTGIVISHADRRSIRNGLIVSQLTNVDSEDPERTNIFD